MFTPQVLNPTPEPWFVRELKRVDPDLRVVWGYQRYLKNAWAIERKIPPERYFSIYSWLLSGDQPRFVEQPIFDTNDSETDPETGEHIRYKQIGTRTYDLAPEYEWVLFTDALNDYILTELKRAYAWERNHPLSRLRYEKEQEIKAKEDAQQAKLLEAGMEGVDEAALDTRVKVQFGYGAKRDE